ncbi:MAG: hypothetical protein IPK21_17365 [Haliscomenobacter sp.]|nr:hypothetical protein [Haliscomenobacter sp.]
MVSGWWLVAGGWWLVVEWLGKLAQKTNLCYQHEISGSFFDSNKKLQSDFLFESKKEPVFGLPWTKTAF